MHSTTQQPPYGYAASPHKETMPLIPTRQYANYSKSSAFSSSANPDEDWTKIADLGERRRIQNRIAQRNYRKKIKRRLEDIKRRAGSPFSDAADATTEDSGKKSPSPSSPSSARSRRGSGNSSSSSKKGGARPPRQKKQQHTLTSLSVVEATVLKRQQQLLLQQEQEQQKHRREASSSPFPHLQQQQQQQRFHTVLTPPLHPDDDDLLFSRPSVSSSISSASSCSSGSASSSSVLSAATVAATSTPLYSRSTGATLDPALGDPLGDPLGHALDDALGTMTLGNFLGSGSGNTVYSRGHSPLEPAFHQQRHPSPSAFVTAATTAVSTPLSSSGYPTYPPPSTELVALSSDDPFGRSIGNRDAGRSSSATSSFYTPAAAAAAAAAAADVATAAERASSTTATASEYDYAYNSSWHFAVDEEDASAMPASTITPTLAAPPPYMGFAYLTSAPTSTYDTSPPTPPQSSACYGHHGYSKTGFDFSYPTTPLSMADSPGMGSGSVV